MKRYKDTKNIKNHREYTGEGKRKKEEERVNEETEADR